jgi:oxalate---CoA ligase
MGEPVFSDRSRDASRLSVHSLLRAQAECSPLAIALSAPGRAALTYHRLCAHIDTTIRSLHRMGAGRNARVALLLPQGPEMAVALLAAAAGAICIPLNPASRTSECEFYFADLNPTLLVIQAGMDVPARSVAMKHGIPIIELVPDPGAEAGSFTLVGKGRPASVPWIDAQPDDAALMLYTSGTTSKPKLVPLTHTNLCTSARNLRASLGLDEQDRCLDVMPLFHIHGIMVALGSLLTGASVACPPRFDVTAFFSWLEELLPTWYSAVPTIHHAIAAQAEFHRTSIARCPLRFIRSCSAPLPLRVARDLEQIFSTLVIEAYGMTEAAHQISSNPLPPRQRKDGSVGLGSGVEVAIVDAGGNRLPEGETGEVAIRGLSVMREYANDPAASAQAFTDGWFRTGDIGRLDSEGYLFLSGRIKEIINRGGTKISPREVDDILLAHPAVAQAAAFPIPHPTLGEDTAAAVVLQDSAFLTGEELRAFLAARLSDFKVPQRIFFVDAIPKGPTGKLERARLATQLGALALYPAQFEAEADCTAPHTPLESTLADICCQVLRLPQLGIHSNLFHAGADSISAMLIISRIREVLCVGLSARDIFAAPTVAALAVTIADHLAQGLDRDTRARLLAEIEGLSEADVAQCLMRGMSKGTEDAHA